MKDNVYLLYNTNASNIKIQKQPGKRQDMDWEYIDKDKFTINYSSEDVRKSTEIKIESKTKLRERPKSAGEVLVRPKIHAEGVIIKRSASLSNIDDFFLKRRVPVIRPLISEKEILKLQHLQAQCRKKRFGIEPDEVSLKTLDGEDKDLKDLKGSKGFHPSESEEEKSKTRQDKDKTRDVSSPLQSSLAKREDQKRQADKKIKEIEEGRKAKSPASEKGTKEKEKGKKILGKGKDPSHDRSTSREKGKKKKDHTLDRSASPEKRAKKEKTNKKGSPKGDSESLRRDAKSPRDVSSSARDKVARSKESPKKTTKKSDEIESKSKLSKGKNKSEEEGFGTHAKHKDSSMIDSKGSSRKSSKQKLKSGNERSENESKEKRSKDKISQGKKSDKSDRSGSGKSRKQSDSSKKRKGSNFDGEDQDDMSTKDRKKPLSDGSGEGRKSRDNGDNVDQSAKGDKKKKEESERGDKKKKQDESDQEDSKRKSGDSELGTKDKTAKTNAEKLQKSTYGKSVKFNNVFDHGIHYVLSDKHFYDLGWTCAPTDRAQLQIVTFRAVPSAPQSHCFRERTEDEIKYYCKALDSIAFHFRMDGTGDIFYPSGVKAATITKHDRGMRLTLFSEPKNDPLIQNSFNSKVLAIFDSFGNGVVYDVKGNKILNFNQLEGKFCTPQRKAPYKWQWCDYKMLDKQRIKALLRHIAKEQKEPVQSKKSTTPVSGGSPKKGRSDDRKSDDEYEKILAELPHPSPHRTRTNTETHIWGFKPITLKISNEMTLRINGQDDIVLNFSSNQIFLRMDLGVKVDPDVVERIEAMAPKKPSIHFSDEVPCVFDGLLNPSPSLQQLAAQIDTSLKRKKHSTR